MKISHKKRFGQHFLEDRCVIEKIVRAVNPQKNDFMVEIGAGTGRLTDHLIGRAGKLVLIELDRDLAAYLNIQYRDKDVSIIQKDVLKVNFNSIFQDCLRDFSGDFPGDYKFRIIGNLPYNISTPLLFHLIQFTQHIDGMIFMLQKEVAQRLCAVPGNKNYGRLSVMVGLHLQCVELFNVPPAAFNPPPAVESTVLTLQPQAAKQAVNDPQFFSHLVREAFSQRRKTLRNSLQNLVTSSGFQSANIDSGLRAENLSISDYVNLSNAVSTVSNDSAAISPAISSI